MDGFDNSSHTRVSVMVAVYNTESTLERCVESIQKQTYGDLEIILVDDGSTDHSLALCERLAKTDSRIRVVHEENGGLAQARNTGLANAHGSFYCFADSDDYYLPNMVERLLHAERQTDADIVICDYFKTHGEVPSQGGQTVPSKRFDGPSDGVVCYTPEKFMPLLLTDRISSHAMTKLYKPEVWQGVSFPLGNTVEDMYVMPDVFSRAHKVACISDKLYAYWAANPNNTSNSRRWKLSSSWDRALALKKRLAMADASYPDVADEVFRQTASFQVSSYYKAAIARDSRADEARAWIQENRERILGSCLRRERKVAAWAALNDWGRIAILVLRKLLPDR